MLLGNDQKVCEERWSLIFKNKKQFLPHPIFSGPLFLGHFYSPRPIFGAYGANFFMLPLNIPPPQVIYDHSEQRNTHYFDSTIKLS